MRKVLAPIVAPEFAAPVVESELIAYLDDVLLTPLKDALGELRENSADPIIAALNSGQIQYHDGRFVGKFNAAISLSLRNFGAVASGNGFELSLSGLPLSIRHAVSQAKAQAEEKHRELLSLLAFLFTTVLIAPTGIDFGNTFDSFLEDLHEQFRRSVSSGGKTPPLAPSGMSSRLREEFTSRVRKAAQNLAATEAHDLRLKIQQNFAMGARLDRLDAIVEAEGGVLLRKARIVSEAEVAGVVADFTKSRCEDMGITSYVWETMGDHKVRPTRGEANNHRNLEGREFSFSNPPVVDSATGRRCHPGEDYGPCRCVARPILVT